MSNRLLSLLVVALWLASCGRRDALVPEPLPPLNRASLPCSLTIAELGLDGDYPLIALAFRNNTEEPLLLYRWPEPESLSAFDEPPDNTIHVDYFASSGQQLEGTKIAREAYSLYDPSPASPADLTKVLPGATYRTSLMITEEYGYDKAWQLPVKVRMTLKSDVAVWLRDYPWKDSSARPLLAFCDKAQSNQLEVSRASSRTKTLKLIRSLQRERKRIVVLRIGVSAKGSLRSCEVEDVMEQDEQVICASVGAWEFSHEELDRSLTYKYAPRSSWYGPG